MSRFRRKSDQHANQLGKNSREIAYNVQRAARSQHSDDIFATNPLRRSFFIAFGSWLVILIPIMLLKGDAQALVLIGAGWLAAAGIIFVTPIFFWFLFEVVWSAIRRRTTPLIEELNLSPRAYNLLYRHGFETISSVDRTSDTSLSLLSNMDARTLREIRRSVNLWKYQRWQDRGFPHGETPESLI